MRNTFRTSSCKGHSEKFSSKLRKFAEVESSDTSKVHKQDSGISFSEKLLWTASPALSSACVCVRVRAPMLTHWSLSPLPLWWLPACLFYLFFARNFSYFFQTLTAQGFLLFSCNSSDSFFLVLERAPVILPNSLRATLWCPKPNPSTNLHSSQPPSLACPALPPAVGSHQHLDCTSESTPWGIPPWVRVGRVGCSLKTGDGGRAWGTPTLMYHIFELGLVLKGFYTYFYFFTIPCVLLYILSIYRIHIEETHRIFYILLFYITIASHLVRHMNIIRTS